jgi:hypothetical protein
MFLCFLALRKKGVDGLVGDMKRWTAISRVKFLIEGIREFCVLLQVLRKIRGVDNVEVRNGLALTPKTVNLIAPLPADSISRIHPPTLSFILFVSFKIWLVSLLPLIIILVPGGVCRYHGSCSPIQPRQVPIWYPLNPLPDHQISPYNAKFGRRAVLRLLSPATHWGLLILARIWYLGTDFGDRARTR